MNDKKEGVISKLLVLKKLSDFVGNDTKDKESISGWVSCGFCNLLSRDTFYSSDLIPFMKSMYFALDVLNEVNDGITQKDIAKIAKSLLLKLLKQDDDRNFQLVAWALDLVLNNIELEKITNELL